MTHVEDDNYEALGQILEVVGHKNWVSIPKAAMILGKHAITMRKWVLEGYIEAQVMGKRYVITLQEIARFKEHGNLDPPKLPPPIIYADPDVDPDSDSDSEQPQPYATKEHWL